MCWDKKRFFGAYILGSKRVGERLLAKQNISLDTVVYHSLEWGLFVVYRKLD